MWRQTMNEHEKIAVIKAVKSLFGKHIDDVSEIPKRMRKKQWKALKKEKDLEPLRKVKKDIEAEELKGVGQGVQERTNQRLKDLAIEKGKSPKQSWKRLKKEKDIEPLKNLKKDIETEELKDVGKRVQSRTQNRMDEWVTSETSKQIGAKKRSDLKNVALGTAILGAPVMAYKSQKKKTPKPGNYSGGPVLNRSRRAQY